MPKGKRHWNIKTILNKQKQKLKFDTSCQEHFNIVINTIVETYSNATETLNKRWYGGKTPFNFI